MLRTPQQNSWRRTSAGEPHRPLGTDEDTDVGTGMEIPEVTSLAGGALLFTPAAKPTPLPLAATQAPGWSVPLLRASSSPTVWSGDRTADSGGEASLHAVATARSGCSLGAVADPEVRCAFSAWERIRALSARPTAWSTTARPQHHSKTATVGAPEPPAEKNMVSVQALSCTRRCFQIAPASA